MSRGPLHYKSKGVTTRVHAARDYVISSVQQYRASACMLYQQFWYKEHQETNLLVCYNHSLIPRPCLGMRLATISDEDLWLHTLFELKRSHRCPSKARQGMKKAAVTSK